MTGGTPLQGDLLGSSLPTSTARIIRFATDIAETPADRADFLHSVLCQVGLPRREKGADVRANQWQRVDPGRSRQAVERQGLDSAADPIRY